MASGTCTDRPNLCHAPERQVPNGIGIKSPAALSEGISTNWLCAIGADLLGKTDGRERDKLIPLVAASALMGTLLGGGATHAASSSAPAAAKAANIARTRIAIEIPR